MWEYLVGVLFVVLAIVWFINGLTRSRDMREDQYREGGELDGHIDVRKRNKEK